MFSFYFILRHILISHLISSLVHCLCRSVSFNICILDIYIYISNILYLHNIYILNILFFKKRNKVKIPARTDWCQSPCSFYTVLIILEAKRILYLWQVYRVSYLWGKFPFLCHILAVQSQCQKEDHGNRLWPSPSACTSS